MAAMASKGLRGFIMEIHKSRGAGVNELLQFAKSMDAYHSPNFVFQEFFNTFIDTKVHRLQFIFISAVWWDAHCTNSITF